MIKSVENFDVDGDQKEKLVDIFATFNELYLGEDTYDDQKTAMRAGKLNYEGHDAGAVAERLYRINKQLKLLNTEAQPFTNCKMAREVIPDSRKPRARLKYIDKGGEKLDTEWR